MLILKNYRQITLWLGRFIAIAGVLIVVSLIAEYAEKISFSMLGFVGWSIIFLLAITYGLSNILLALSWKQLVTHLNSSVSNIKAINIYGVSQIGKYLPGNIFHFAGRQALGMSAGLPAWTLIKSTAWELGLLAMTGTFFSALVLPLFLPQVSLVTASGIFVFLCSTALFSVFFIFGIYVVKAAIGYLTFLTVTGVIFYFLVCVITSLPTSNVSFWIGSYVISWLVGMLTPGAPAGVGARELALMFLLEGQAQEQEILTYVLISRGITVLGDLLFYFSSSLLKRLDISNE